MNIKEEKEKIRKLAKNNRAQLTSFERAKFSQEICRKLTNLKEIKESNVLAVFYPLQKEVDIRHYIINSMSRGRSLCVPRVTQKGEKLNFHKMLKNDFRLTTKYGFVRSPTPDTTTLALENIPVMLVPAISADKFGNRIGFGAGFYDITLSKMKNTLLIAPIFSCQVFDQVPTEKHDVKLDIIITEKEIIDTR